MSLPTTVLFARAARTLVVECRRLGLAAPAFRSPPRLPDHERTIRRGVASTVVAVRVHGRGFDAVARDMVEGVLVANRLSGADAAGARTALLAAVDTEAPAVPAPAAAA